VQVIERLGHVGIYVDDLDRMTAFYCDRVGLEVSDSDEGIGVVFLSSHPDDEHHELVLLGGRTAPPGTLAVQQVSFRCVSLPALLEFHADLVAHDVAIDMTSTHGNAISVYFYDPEGNKVEVYWPTGLPARQPFVALLDFSQPADTVLAEVEALVAEFGATGLMPPRPGSG
jgi:catechol-2,3-dioxygenase